MARANPFRFSTKYQDDETDLFYYGYRYHNASAQNRIARYRFKEKAWDTIPVPAETGAALVSIRGRLYLSTDESLLELNPPPAPPCNNRPRSVEPTQMCPVLPSHR